MRGVHKIASPDRPERLFYVQLSNLGQLVAQVAQFVAQIREGFAQSNSAGSTRYLAGRLGLELYEQPTSEPISSLPPVSRFLFDG
jgi:hypothetical protein